MRWPDTPSGWASPEREYLNGVLRDLKSLLCSSGVLPILRKT
jgi:hypothetical protein